MMGFTFSVLVGRYRLRPDSNLPLIYFLVAFGYYAWFQTEIEPRVLYAGVVNALMLRFEFMKGWLCWTLRVAEICVLVYMAWNFYDLIWY